MITEVKVEFKPEYPIRDITLRSRKGISCNLKDSVICIKDLGDSFLYLIPRDVVVYVSSSTDPYEEMMK